MTMVVVMTMASKARRARHEDMKEGGSTEGTQAREEYLSKCSPRIINTILIRNLSIQDLGRFFGAVFGAPFGAAYGGQKPVAINAAKE